MSQALTRLGIESIDSVGQRRAGEDWTTVIERTVDEADAMVFLVGPHTGRESVLHREWSAALERSWSNPNKSLIPVVLGEVERPAFLRTRQAVRAEADGDMDAVARQVAAAIWGRRSLAEVAAPAAGASEIVERQQRLEEIAQQADQQTPTPEQLQREAQQLTVRIVQTQRPAPKAQELAELHVKLADVLKALHQDEEALPNLEQAIVILARPPDAKRRYAHIRRNRAALLVRLKRYPDARREWTAVRGLYRDLDGETSAIAMTARVALLPLHLTLGDLDAVQLEWDGLSDDAKQLVQSLTPILKDSPALQGILGAWLGGASEENASLAGGANEPLPARGN